MDYLKAFQLYIECEQKTQKVCFLAFFSLTNSSSQGRVLLWLENILQNRNKIPKFHEIPNLILRNIKELVNITSKNAFFERGYKVKIDSERTKNLIKTYLPESLNKAIEELNNAPDWQFEFVEKILMDRKKGEIMDKNLLLMNLTLMCKLGLKKEVSFDFRHKKCKDF